LWLVLAPALACPGVTEALPEVELPAAVCAPAERVIRHIEKLAITAILQCFFIVSNNSFSLFEFLESGALRKQVLSIFKMRFPGLKATVSARKWLAWL